MKLIPTSPFSHNILTFPVHMYRRCVLAVSCMFLLAALTGLVSAGWRTTTVDSEGDVGKYTSLGFNATGSPAISYFDYTDGDLKYAFQDGSGVWHNTTVESGIAVGYYTSLAFNATGPAISYRDGYGDALKYAFQDGSGTWHTTTVDSGRNVGVGTSLAFNATGSPAIGYYDSNNRDLKFAFQDGSGVWHNTTVDGEVDVGEYPSLAFNATGPAISYFDSTNFDLKYAFRDGSGVWHNTTVDSGGDVGKYTSLAFDATGCPAISYFDSTYTGLKYAFQDENGVWHTTTADSSPGVGSDTSLAFNATGPAISYHDYVNGNLKFAFQDGSGVWHPTTVDNVVGGNAIHTSLAFNSAGPAISYYDSINDDLKFAWWVPPPAVTLITPDHGVTGTVGLNTTLAGMNFYGTPVVTLKNGLATITATGVIVDSPQKITCTFDLPAGAAPGQWDIVVTNPSGESGILPGGFRVMQQTSTTVYSSLNPAYCGDPITFTAFVAGSAGTAGETMTFMVNGTTWPGSSGIQLNSTGAANITTTSLAGGWHNITAWYNGNATMAPSMGSLDPQVVFSPPIAGFSANATTGNSPLTVNFTDASSGEGVTGYQWILGDDPTTIFTDKNLTHTFTSPGTYAVNHSATNAAGTTWLNQTDFITVSMFPAPTVSSISPNTGVNTTTIQITNLAGSNFLLNPFVTQTVKLNGTGYPDIVATNVNRISSTQISCTFDLAGQPAGVWNVVVTNPDGQSGMLVDGFTITAPLPANYGIGLFRPSISRWYLDYDRNGLSNDQITWGASTDIPLRGDWDNDGFDEIGLWRPSTATWFLDYDNNGWGDFRISWGRSTDIPITGDWDNDGFDEIGLWRPSTATWFLDDDNSGRSDRAVSWGASSDQPVTGDWDNDGFDEIGLWRPSTTRWYLDYDNNGLSDYRVYWGASTDVPITGDWDDDGFYEIGLWRPSTTRWYLDYENNGLSDYRVYWGAGTDVPITGAWS